MTILDNGTRNQYTATSGQTVFVYDFEIFESGDIRVYRNAVLLALTTDYTLTGVGSDGGGNVTLTSGATAGDIYTIFRQVTPERTTDYQESGQFLTQELNDDFDRLWAVIQEQETAISRTLQLTEQTTASLPLFLEDGAAGNLLRWNDTATGIDNVATSTITPGTVVGTDFNIRRTNYAAVRLIDTSTVVDGQVVTVTDNGIAGDFVLRNSAGHGLSDNGGTIIVIDSNWYAERIKGPVVDIRDWGGRDDSGTTDNLTALTNAATYLLSLDYPGGDIIFPKDIGGYYEISDGIDFHDILFTQQGLTVSAAGHLLPNGTAARDVKVRLLGDGTIQTTSGFSNPYLFKFGEYQTVSLGQSMKFEIGSGLQIIGPGSLGGHAATTFISGASGYTSSADVNKGTDDTTVTCIDAQNLTPNSEVNGNIKGFNIGVKATYGFGLAVGGSIQYCNAGIQAEDGFTNLKLLPSLEAEVCGVGLFLNGCDAIHAQGSIIEANVCNVLIYLSRFINFDNLWLEGKVDKDVIIAGDAVTPSLFSRQINFKGCIGPTDLECKTGVVGLEFDRCALGTDYSFSVSSGSPFRDIVFDNCTVDSGAGPFQMDSLSLSGIATHDAITVKGPTENNGQADFVCRTPLIKTGVTSTAIASAQRAFDLIVPNVDTTARIEITAHKKAVSASSMRMQTMRYVGVLQRFSGSASVVEFSTTESLVTNYNTTGTNVPVTVSVPTTTITGGSTAEQTIAIEFPTGTAVAGTADTLWEVKLFIEEGDVTIEA